MVARLHQRRVQVEVVRHHRRAQDADRHIQALAAQARHQARRHLRDRRLRQQDLHEKTAADHRDQREHERLERADAQALQPQQQQRVGRGDHDAQQQRHAEQQVQPDGRPQHLRQVAGGDGDLAKHIQRIGHRPRIGFAARLRQVAPPHDAQPRAQRLQQDRHQVRHHQHPQQLVAEARPALQVRGPVARVHVAHAYQVGRPREGEHAAPDRDVLRPYARVHFRERFALLRHGHCINYS